MTFARSTPLIPADTPLADRLPTADETGAQGEAQPQQDASSQEEGGNVQDVDYEEVK